MRELIRFILKNELKTILEGRKNIFSDEELRQEALKYNTKEDFRNLSKSAYSAALYKGKDFFDSITSHQIRKTKWDDESLEKEASKYDSLAEFRKSNKSAYQLVLNRGVDFLNKITSHMDRKKDKWTDDELIQDALKYQNLEDYIKNSTGDDAARKKGRDFYLMITSHMTRKNRPTEQIKKYSDDELKTEALKYNTRSEFSKKNNDAYRQALAKGIDFYESIIQHMGDIGDIKKRMIYAFLFPNNVIYVGLTYKIEIREKQHLQVDDDTKKSPVKDYINKTGQEPKLIKLTDYLPYKEAQQKEDEFIKKYTDKGYTILNTQKAGNLGAGPKKWTKNKLKQLALKYDNVYQFYKENRSAYQTATNMGILKDITSHMSRNRKVRQVWTKEDIFKILPNYLNYADFYKKNKSAYRIALSLSIIDDIKKYYTS